MTLLAYLLKVIVVSAILFGYYRLFLRNKRFHHYNRFFLLSALLLSVVLPFIRIPLLYQPENPVNDAVYRTVSVINTDYGEEMPAESVAPMSESVFTLMNSIYLLYAVGVLFLLTLVFKSLLYIRTLRKRYPAEKITSLRFYNTHEPGTPFSFFRSIFWNEQLSFNSREGQQIFRHELFHVQHQHSADRLLSEVLTAIFWFNPFFHLIKKELKAIHEFLADQFACSGSDRYAYASLLVQQALESGKHAVTNHFFQNHIKRRIAMITQFQQSKYGYWSRVMVLPVSLLLFCFITLYAKKPASGPAKKLTSAMLEQPLTVLVDVGHGGADPGAVNEEGNVKEKDLTLQIARKIQQLAASRNINVVMTRDGDYLAGNKANAPEALHYITSLISDLKPDAVISVHVGAAVGGNATHNGIDFYITGKNIPGMRSSRLLGEFLAASMDPVYKINRNLLTRKDKGIWVLDQAVQPAVLIECGYLTNAKDLSFISDPANQKKIAAAILDGVVNFKKAGPVPEPSTDTIPDKIKKEREMMEKMNQARLEQLKRQLQEQEEVIKKAQRVELEALKKQMQEKELMMKEREQNRKEQMEHALELRKELLNRQVEIDNEVRLQQKKMLELMKDHEEKAKENPAYKKESEAQLELLKQKMKEVQLNMKNQQQAEADMMRSKIREIEEKTKWQQEESKNSQENLRTLKQQLLERESMLKKVHQAELDRIKEELRRNEKERKDKENEIRRQREREERQKENEKERDNRKDNEHQESSFNQPAKFIQDEDALLKNVIRQYLRNIRYPEHAIQNGAQGDIYFSVIVDQKGFFTDFKTYSKPPNAKNIRDLVIVTDKLPYIVAEKQLTDDEKAAILKKEMERTTVKNNEKPVPHPESRQYYFRAVFKMNNLKENNTFLIKNAADWETKLVSKPVNQKDLLWQDTIPAKPAARAKAAAKSDAKASAKAAAKAKPYDKDIQKPKAPAKISKEPTDPDNRKAHRLSEPRKLKATKDLKPVTAEKRKMFPNKPAKLFEEKRAKLFADKSARAKSARKAAEKPRKVKTKPAKEDGSEQIPDEENEENYSEISVTGDK
jgi:N-acetylmuramoyl-L-alanine amidase